MRDHRHWFWLKRFTKVSELNFSEDIIQLLGMINSGLVIIQYLGSVFLGVVSLYSMIAITPIPGNFTEHAVYATGNQPASSYKLVVEPDKTEAIYDCEEEIVFTVSVSDIPPGAPPVQVKWVITKDGVQPPLQEGDFMWAGKPIKFSARLHEPGFLQFQAVLNAERGQVTSTLCAVAVSPSMIQPGLPEPDDFDTYWKGQRNIVDSLPKHLKIVPVASTVEGVDCFDVQADIDGATFSAYLALPSGSSRKSLPGIVLPHAAGVLSSRRGMVCKWAQDGFIAIDFNAHGLPNGKKAGYYEDLREGELKGYSRKFSTNPDSMFFNVLFRRVLYAIDIVTRHPAWDNKILVANGRSQGGGQAIAAAGLDSRVGFVAAQIPALCDHGGALIGRISGWPKIVDVAADVETKMQQARVASYFDCAYFASRTTAQVVLSVGFIDQVCPPTSVYAAYNLFRGKKEMINHLKSGHKVDPKTDSLIRAHILQFVKDRRNDNGER